MARPKTYQINEEYFNSPLTERGAYLLGLIMSDGHLNYDYGYFQYVCSKRDISILEFIKTELESTHPIKKSREVYVRYSITNKQLVRNIINKYSLPHSNKSQNNINIPHQLNATLIPHFLRGFFDGDGSI
jgi:intein/homing endonuclease